jgi:hypothetical protein
MKSRGSRLLQAALVVALVVALAVPGIALAKPQAKNLRAKASRAASVTAGFKQPRPQMEKRVNNVLAARERRFAAAEANISKKIERVRVLADKISAEASGSIDATAMAAVYETLESAEAHLAAASAMESDTVGPAFKSMLDAANKRAAFLEAKKAGRASVAELKLARQDVREAARLLRGIVQSLKPTEDAATSDS